MSDRRRRWICQFVFVAMCVLPTAWVFLRIAFRPGPEFYAQQLQLHLGAPVTVGSVSTPTPDFTWLHQVRLQHPESGCWAVADRIALYHGNVGSRRPSWQIDRLVVRESTLADLFAQLHHTIVRQQLHSNLVPVAAKEQSFPLVHIRSLMVMPGEIGLLGEEEVLRPAVNLKDVMVDWRTGADGNTPRLVLAAKLVPLRQISEVLAVVGAEVPIIGSLERYIVAHPASAGTEYVTRWDVAILDRSVPVAWLNLAVLPAFVRDRPELEFSGWIGGNVFGDRWQWSCREARVNGWDLSDIEYLASGQRSRLKAPVRVNIHQLAWSGMHGGPTQWDACDVELNAGNGEMDGRLVEATRQALGLSSERGPIQPASYDPSSEGSGAVQFDQLNLGVRWRDGRWWFRPLGSDDNPLPVLRGSNHQDQVDWPGRDERAWSWNPTNHETARVDYSEKSAEVEPIVRKPLEIAPFEFLWQPTEFIQGVPKTDDIRSETGWSSSRDTRFDRVQIRQWLEHPSSFAEQ